MTQWTKELIAEAREDNDGMRRCTRTTGRSDTWRKRLMRDLWRAWRDDLKMPAEREAA